MCIDRGNAEPQLPNKIGKSNLKLSSMLETIKKGFKYQAFPEIETESLDEMKYPGILSRQDETVFKVAKKRSAET